MMGFLHRLVVVPPFNPAAARRALRGVMAPQLAWAAAALLALLLPALALLWSRQAPTELDAATHRVLWWSLLLQVLTLGSLLAAAWWLWVRRPFARLRRQALRLAEGGPGRSDTRTAGPSTLFGALDDMTEDLQQAQQRITHLMDELEARHREMHRMAMVDALTGLPNRRLLRVLFERAAALALRNGRSMALLFVDLDRFKAVNERYGQPAGDEVLLVISQRLRDVMRGSDVVGRLGGDEFVVLLTDVRDFEAIGQTALRILQTTEMPVLLGSGAAHGEISASVGVARFPRDGEDFDTLLQHADQALYRAKTLGRRRYALFQPTLADDDRMAEGGDAELLHALDRGEMQLHYQPMVDTATGRVVGIEALLRWQHPHEGLLLPARFIHRAAESGQLQALGRVTLEQACAQLASWKQAGGRPARLSINVSAAQFRHADWVQDLQHAMARHQTAGSELAVELSENALMDEPESTRERLQALRALGVALVIDDFGAGLISLSRLGELRPAMVKLDPAFLQHLPDDPQAQALVAGIVGLARSLAIDVAAEGVETQAQRDVLIRLGCPVQQGHWFARPGPAPAESAWPAQPGWTEAAEPFVAHHGDGPLRPARAMPQPTLKPL